MKEHNLRQTIVNEALALMTEKDSLQFVNLREVAKRAGCAHTNIYNYFPSLGELKWEMLRRALELMKSYCFPASDESVDISAIIEKYIDFALIYPAFYKLIWIESLPLEHAPADRQFLFELPDTFERILMQIKGKEQNSDDDYGQYIDIAHSYVHGKLLQAICNRADNKQSLREDLVSNALRLLHGG